MCAKSKVFVQMKDAVPCKSLKIKDFPFDERPSYISTLSKTFVQMMAFQADAGGLGSTGMPVSGWVKTRESTCIAARGDHVCHASREATSFRLPAWVLANRPSTPGEGMWSLLDSSVLEKVLDKA